MVVYYENSRGEKLNLLKRPYRTVEADWFDADWKDSTDGYEKTVSIDVFGDKAEFQQNMETLYRILSLDSETGTYGRLYVNGSFLRCRVQASKKSGWKGYVYSEAELTFYAPELSWIEVLSQSFYAQDEAVTVSGMDFEYDHDFDFTESKRGVASLEVDHSVASDFQMLIYGPCVNPKIIINDWTYEVKTTLESGEYILIDSQECTITKYKSNGFAENIFNDRGYVQSVFEPIPSGMLLLNWSGLFGFDLTLFLKRREAKW